MEKPVNVVVIGYGYAGRCFHSYLIKLTPGLTLYGVASRRAEIREQIEKEQGCRAYLSFEAVLNDPAVDVVVLATPNSTHAKLAIQAMNAGKHVVTDKVMCLTLEECDQMIECSQRNRRILSVFQNRRWDGDFLTLKKLVAEGKLGKLRWLEMAWQGFGPMRGWRARADFGGGRYYDLGAHLVDQALLFFSSPVDSVYCRLQFDFQPVDTESNALLLITFAEGTTAICDLSSLNTIVKPRFYACGTEATFIKYGLDPQEQAMVAGDIDRAKEEPYFYGRLKKSDGQEEVIPTLPGRWRSFYENIAQVLSGKAELAVKPEEVRRTIAVLAAGRQSAGQGQVLRISV
ncbi:MAG: Gfo/Idh/MocA family oxidoreductase [Candidatus Omnitrophica bacterium]|nr:Gfo/Idh/MocA family oxidoreductase [Candidatus Omnitrophota bacterium]